MTLRAAIGTGCAFDHWRSSMIAVFAVLLVLHGLIHLLGFAKGFGLADLPELTQPIPALMGAVWLLAAVVSLLAIAPSWTDAKFGAFFNIVVMIGVVFGFLAQGPGSLRAQYDADVAHGLARSARPETLIEADIVNLPAPVQRYLRTAGVIGQPRVRNFRVRMHGRIRSDPDNPWMPITAEQHNFIDEPARLFYFNASMKGLPVQGYHRFVGPSATMVVKAAALFRVVDASGPEMDQSETVTMFNDMCFLAPATLISRAIAWDSIDAHTVKATFTNAGRSIRAELLFNDAGELINFWSDDRYQSSPDGKTARKQRWSTPLSTYRSYGSVRIASTGEARWHDAAGDYAYIELAIDEVHYNVPR